MGRPQGNRVSPFASFAQKKLACTLGLSWMIIILSIWPAYFLSLETEGLLLPPGFETKVAEIGKSLKVTNEKSLTQANKQSSLSWLFATDANLNAYGSKNLIPKGLNVENRSRFLDYGNSSYFDAVIAQKNKIYLHGGFKTGPRTLSTSIDAPIQFVSLWIIWISILSSIAISLSITIPLKRYMALASAGLDGEASARQKLNEIKWAPFEINALVALFESIQERFDQARAVQAELSGQNTELKAKNENLKQELHELLHQSHKNFSEFTSREAEDSLLKSIDTDSAKCESAHEICQKTLDHLLDRFPSSIKQAAFFLPNKDGQFNLETYVGLDDITINVLKSKNQDLLVEHVFSKGTVVSLLEDDLDSYGYRQCTLHSGWKAALYVPIECKGKRLALLAVYFDERLQSFINDRRRVLQKVQELLNTILHRLSILEQELKSARTDTLTGLYNKKFFEEIVGPLMRKSNNKNRVSFLMLDGDHFKQINDTFGHQTGDQMLKALAELMIINTRHVDDLKQSKRERDYIIRWGGEEFLIILEGTDSDLAMLIAERLRKAVSDKTDWPGGVEKWTLSIGVATFPEDGGTADELVGSADTALYYCKKILGRNKISTYRDVPESSRKVILQAE